MKHLKKFDNWINEEIITAQDYKNKLELDMETAEDEKNIKDEGDLQKLSKLKITDIQRKMEFLNKQKADISGEITKLQNIQRDMMPDNPSDPNNKANQQKFIEEQNQKILAQQNKLKAFDDEIKLLKSEIDRNKKKYGV